MLKRGSLTIAAMAVMFTAFIATSFTASAEYRSINSFSHLRDTANNEAYAGDLFKVHHKKKKYSKKYRSKHRHHKKHRHYKKHRRSRSGIRFYYSPFYDPFYDPFYSPFRSYPRHNYYRGYPRSGITFYFSD